MIRSKSRCEAKSKQELEALHGKVWSITELARDFILIGIQGGRLRVKGKRDGRRGSLSYQLKPCFFFGFELEAGQQ